MLFPEGLPLTPTKFSPFSFASLSTVARSVSR